MLISCKSPEHQESIYAFLRTLIDLAAASLTYTDRAIPHARMANDCQASEDMRMSHLHVALFLVTALDITALYTAAFGWLRGVETQLAASVASCTHAELGSGSKRPS